MAYIYPNYKSKKLFKQMVADGDRISVRENTPRGQVPIITGHATIEGPHYPKPHTWYATCQVKDGVVVKGSIK